MRFAVLYRRRSIALAAISLSLILPVVASATALAQHHPDRVNRGIETVSYGQWYTDVVTSALLTFVIGGLLIALAPGATRRCTDRALEKPGLAFLYGIGSLIGVIGLFFLLAITIIGIFVAIPMLFGYVLAVIVAVEFGVLAVGRLVADDWGPALLIAVVVSAVTAAVPVLGTLAAFVIGFIGVGTVVMGFLEGRSSNRQRYNAR